MARIVTDAPATLSVTFTEADEDPASADGNVTVTVVDAEGVTVVDNQNCSGSGGTYTRLISGIAEPTQLTATWGGTFGGAAVTATTKVEVVGARLATVPQVRALEGLDDTTVFPTAVLEEAIEYAEDVIDDYCGSMFVPRLHVIRRGSTYSADESMHLPLPYVQALRFVTDDGTDATSSYEIVDGRLRCTTGWITTDPLVVGVDTGPTDGAPPGIKWAARTIARHYALNLVSRIPDRALSVQSDFGQIQMAQPGGLNRPTGFPEVNAELSRHRVYAHLVG